MPVNPTLQRTTTWLVDESPTAVRWVVAAGFGAFLMLMGTLSFPLPWTPVPFSMMPFALLVAGAAQRPAQALASVVIYLAAGGLGAPVFAGGESGWSHFVGATGGYLFAFLTVPPLVALYLRRRRAALSDRVAAALVAFVALAMAAGTAAIAWTWSTGQGLSALDDDVNGWGVGRSVLWFLLFLIAAMTATVVWVLRRRRAEATAALDLFVVMLGAIAVLHAIGVTVLWLATDLSFMAAVVLGSIVFLPFDIVKAGAAVAVALPFAPERTDAPRGRAQPIRREKTA
jgi:biotin transport system substrate-specific component